MQSLSEQRQSGRARRALILFFAQGGFSGRSPFAPGTAGSLAAVPLYMAASGLSWPVYASVVLVIVAVGVWAADRAEELLGKKDHPSIVIDEIAGFFITMFLLKPEWEYVMAGFVLFRLFDIWKPFPLHRLQQMHGGLGVMLDDIGAGVYANIVLQTIRLFTGI